ncbi:MAG TPA: hypothetical protein VFS16_17050 [Acidimicrobiia bacterium]|nr:hypothetical protein [Acidimicrobiia bacterium]
MNERLPVRVWVSGEPASVTGSIARALELELKECGGQVVLAAGRAPASARTEAGGHLVEVVVGDATPAGPGEASPDVVVSGDGARAGESARAVLRHLAASGYSDLDEYSDDDEAAVSVRLQAFGYL